MNKGNQVVLFSRSSSNVEEERERQINYARQILNEEDEESDVRGINDGRGFLESNKKYQKQKKTGHEACLAKMIAERRSIEIIFRDMQDNVIGELLEFDEFAIRVREENQTCTWYFKSAIAGFKEVGR